MAVAESRKKLTRGRQKIEMKLIDREDDRLITFSKRRSGIYKKASELSTLCGAEVGFIVFSPSGKPFSFAHPSMESVTGKVLNQTLLSHSTHSINEAKLRLRIGELNKKHNELLNQLEAEKEIGIRLQNMKDFRGNIHGWWDAPIDELGLEELQQMNKSMANLYNNIGLQLKGRDVIAVKPSSSSSSSSFQPINGGEEINPLTDADDTVLDSSPICFSPPYH